MTKINDSIECCGIGEIVDIIENEFNPKQTIREVCTEMYENGKTSAFLIFSDIGNKTAGRKLANHIIKRNLGTITKAPTTINSNSGNSLGMWIWTINKRNLRNYYNRFVKEKTIYD